MTARNTTAIHRTTTTTTTTTTQTIESHAQSPLHSSTQTLPTLRLRAERSDGRRIQWAEDVIDNEGMGKKSSKVCCLYHKTRAVGESSSDDDSDDSSSSSDKDASINSGRRDDGRARMGGEGSSKGKHKSHSHMSSEGCAEGKAQRTRKSPNAYEKMPKSGVSKKTER